MRPATKILIRTAGLAAVIVAAVTATASYFLSKGPVSLGFLSPYVESALSLVQPAVDDAIERTCKYAIPYFGEISKAQGYANDWEHAMRGQP